MTGLRRRVVRAGAVPAVGADAQVSVPERRGRPRWGRKAQRQHGSAEQGDFLKRLFAVGLLFALGLLYGLELLAQVALAVALQLRLIPVDAQHPRDVVLVEPPVRHNTQPPGAMHREGQE